MSWGFTRCGKDKEKLKASVRKELTQYQTEPKTKEMMDRVADAVCTLIDAHQVGDGRMIRVETSGHLDTSTGGAHNCKLDITNWLACSD